MPQHSKPAQSRDAMLAQLRQTHSRIKTVKDFSTQTKEVSAPKNYDFKQHPAYTDVRIAKAAGDTLSIRSPFFRVIEDFRSTEVKIDGRWVANFASYDYLSLNLSEEIRSAVSDTVGTFGVSATASRLVGGERSLHTELEARLASFVGTEATLAFVSGHATNLAIVTTLVGPGDLVLVDALAHNSIYEGIRASGAKHLTFPHNDHAWVDRHLETARADFDNVLIVVEGLYSMDGDAPDLERFVAAKRRHGTWLMVDEAHSLGVLGATGRGLCEEQGVSPSDVDVIMGTLSKSFCSCGGFVAGSEALIDLMRYRAPGFVYSVGLSMPNTAAALAAVDTIDRHPEHVAQLRDVCRTFHSVANSLGLDTGPSQSFAVCPIIIGNSLKAVWAGNRLLDAGYNVLPIIAPAVPDRSARLRFFINRDHTEETIRAVLEETKRLLDEVATMSITDMAAE